MATIDYRRTAAEMARRYGIDPNRFVRQIGAESGFNPRARSPVGATGIAQIMPATARGWGVDPNDPVASLNAAARAMSKYLRSYGGDWRKALAAYNAGPGAVAKYGGVPPYRETQNYIKKILSGQDPNDAGAIDSGGDDVSAPFSNEPSGVNQAAILAALRDKGPDQSLTSTVGRAVLQQRALMQNSLGPEINYDPVNANEPVEQPSRQGINSYKPDGSYKWAEDLARKFGVRMSSTYRDPAHNARVGGSRTSRHMTRGAAVDFAGTPAQMRALALAAMASGKFKEVFYDPVGQFDNGRRSPRGIGGHSDHVHITLF